MKAEEFSSIARPLPSIACLSSGDFALPVPDVSGIRMGRYRLTLACPDGLSLDRFPGFLVHGVLGAVLAEISPAAYQALFGEEDLIKPWLIVPMPAQVLSGQECSLEFRCFNEANTHALSALSALGEVGRRGLGRERSRFVVREVCSVMPEQELPIFTRDGALLGMPQMCALDEWLSLEVGGQASGRLALRFETPVRIKNGDQILRQTPDFGVLMRRIVGRISLLKRDSALPRAQMQALIAIADSVQIERSSLTWQDCSRYSARQAQTMSFGGLMGSVAYGHEANAFLPWLRLAELLGIGGKTSFGLGQVRVLVET